ncbi:hypothetical protein [Sediminicola luteus]|uniref:hypothetical protein n=1 Tax=Sediminicola luteus TaxID=319238 RepID=UPI001C0F0D41|nr:hypothetical protein [Sediminicola luteus]
MDKVKQGVLFTLFLFGYYSGQAQIEEDKLKHLGAGAAIGAVGGWMGYELFNGQRGWMYAGAIGSSAAAGVAKELYDQPRHGVWDNADIAYTVLGGLISGVVLDLVLPRNRRSRHRHGPTCGPLAVQFDSGPNHFELGASGNLAAAFTAQTYTHP